MAKKKQRVVRFRCVSIKPDLTQYKIHDALFEPDRPMFVDIPVGEDTVIDEDNYLTTLDDLFTMCDIITTASQVVHLERDDERKTKINAALKTKTARRK